MATIDAPLTNDTIAYTYDQLGRVIQRTINGSANQVDWTFDALGRVTSEEDDPGPRMIVLRPGIPAGGRVNLLTLYPQLKRISSETEVIVFWSYQPKRGKFKTERNGGLVTLPVQ